MKKTLLVFLLTLLMLAVFLLVGALLFRHFVTDQITDRGGMENPDAAANEAETDDPGTQTLLIGGDKKPKTVEFCPRRIT